MLSLQKNKTLTGTKIILVDDHEVVRTGIIAGLMLDSSIEVIGEASNATELLNLLKSSVPDILVLDISMPEMSGIDLCKIVKKENPHIGVIIFSGSFDENQIFESLEAGADAFLPKESSNTELISAINQVKSGITYISPKLPDNLIARYISQKKEPTNKVSLTDREREVIELIANGLSYKDIAEKLFISHKTVEKHKRNLMKKLELKSTADIVKYAIKNKIISL